MKFLVFFGISLAWTVMPVATWAQEPKKSEAEFVKDYPAIGDTFPDLIVHDSNGTEVRTSSLRGHYTVLTFGCLT